MSERITRKDKRAPRGKAKAIDRSCRNHGSCPWCKGNRLHSTTKRKESVCLDR
jgi:hypothetical protein